MPDRVWICDACSLATIGPHITDADVCLTGDGPGFWLCDRDDCIARRNVPSLDRPAARAEFYAEGRRQGLHPIYAVASVFGRLTVDDTRATLDLNHQAALAWGTAHEVERGVSAKAAFRTAIRRWVRLSVFSSVVVACEIRSGLDNSEAWRSLDEVTALSYDDKLA